MKNKEIMASGDATGLSCSASSPVVSTVSASIPDAWRRTFRMEWSMDSGPVTFTYPGDMTEGDIVDLKALLEVAFQGMARRAQGIAARSDETRQAAQPERQEPGPKDAPNPLKEPTHDH